MSRALRQQPRLWLNLTRRSNMPDGTCTIPGCTNKRYARGWCYRHYRCWWATGDPRPKREQTAEERFWKRVDRRGPDECWEWDSIAPNSHGYGYFRHELGTKRSVSSHRFAYELLVGPIPDGLELDHLCRNRACCNPAHLEPVTHAENVRRGEAGKHHAVKTHCPQGHPYDAENTYWRPDRPNARMCRACGREANRRRIERLNKEKSL